MTLLDIKSAQKSSLVEVKLWKYAFLSIPQNIARFRMMWFLVDDNFVLNYADKQAKTESNYAQKVNQKCYTTLTQMVKGMVKCSLTIMWGFLGL